MLSGRCLQCGSSSHFASTCSAGVDAVSYKCRNCTCYVVICEAGRSVTVRRALVDCAVARRAGVVEDVVAAPVAAPLPVPGLLLNSSSTVVRKPAPKNVRRRPTVITKHRKVKKTTKKASPAKAPPNPKRVTIGGEEFSVPAWVIGCAPSTKRYNAFRSAYGRSGGGLVVLSGGDTKTVRADARRPQELLASPDRPMAASKAWRRCAVPGGLSLRRPLLREDTSATPARNMLWRLSDLREFFLS